MNVKGFTDDTDHRSDVSADVRGEERTIRLQEKLQDLRATFHSYVERVQAIGAIGSKEISELSSGLDKIKDENEIFEAEQFLARSERSANNLRDGLELQLTLALASNLISAESKDRWIKRFEDPSASYKRKEYFVERELPRRLENCMKLMKEREQLLASPHLAKCKGLPELKLLQHKDRFISLQYKAKVHVISILSAAIKSPEKDGSVLFATAHARLQQAANQGYLSSTKVGVWLKRIFEKHQDEDIEKFLHGTDANSLSHLLMEWKTVADRFDAVGAKLGRSEHVGRGFRLVSKQKFLDMHYNQRLSYVREAERVVETSVNIEHENPLLLSIRHCLDIEDWETAEEKLDVARKEDLSVEDRSRLQSMRNYLKQHRTDHYEHADEDGVVRALVGISSVLKRMDPSMSSLVEKLLPEGNDAIHNLRWTVYNYVWCNKNGFIDQKKAQEKARTYRTITKERFQRQEDVGTNDVAIDGAFIRDDDGMKSGLRKNSEKGTYQIVNLEDQDVVSALAKYYSEDHDEQVLYWTTLVATDNAGNTKSDAWHQSHFSLLTELRGYTRTLDDSGLAWRGLGLNPRRLTQEAPEDLQTIAA